MIWQLNRTAVFYGVYKGSEGVANVEGHVYDHLYAIYIGKILFVYGNEKLKFPGTSSGNKMKTKISC